MTSGGGRWPTWPTAGSRCAAPAARSARGWRFRWGRRGAVAAAGCGGMRPGAERFAKQGRLQHVQAELAEVEGRLAAGRVSVCRGGRRLAKLRHTLEDAKLTSEQWRTGWQAERLFLTADGDAEYPLGNGTIVVHPE